jgi:outer membrane usher protein
MLSADWRGGFGGGLTLQAHGEAAPRVGVLGGGAALGLGHGFIAADIAASSSSEGSGLMVALSARFNLGRLNLFGAGQVSNGRFRDLAALDGFAPSRWRLQGGATADLAQAGMLSLSWIGEKRADREAQSLLTASWSLPLPGGISFAATALHDIAGGDTGAQIGVAIPLGARGLTSLSASSEGGRAVLQALYDSPANPDGGFGYRLGLGSAQGARLQAEGRYIGEQFGAGTGVALSDGRAALRADVAGALVFLRGSVFATRDPGEAVALVQTGAPGIRIYRENRLVAVSDDDGRALLTGLGPHVPNHVAVEALDYPFDTQVERTAMIVAPPRRGAALVDLSPPVRHPLLAMVRRGAVAMPAGARVRFDGEDAAMALGRDGRLFVADLKAPRGAMIEAGTERCRIYLTPDQAAGLTDAASLTCFREPALAY